MEQLQHIINACAAATKAKGFDLTQHATTIGLIATEVTEAIRCLKLDPDTFQEMQGLMAPPIQTYIMRLKNATDYLEQYRKDGTDHYDNTTVADQEHLLEELADICIRVFSYVGANEQTDAFIQALLAKIVTAPTRPRLHGKQF